MKIVFFFDFHDTIVNSSKAWIKAFKYFCPKKEYTKVKKLYKYKTSRKKLAKMINVDYLEIENKYRENLKPNKSILNLLIKCKKNHEVIILSNSSKEKLHKDINKIGIDIKTIYSKEDGVKPDPKYINKLVSIHKSDLFIMIGNDKKEDVLIHKKIKCFIIKNKIDLLIIPYKVRKTIKNFEKNYLSKN